MERIFALGAEFLAALYAEEHTIIAFRLFAKLAVAEMIPLGKVVTVPAPTLASLGHFAVCALLLGATRSRHKDLPKPRPMIFAKASTQAKDLRKFIDIHEAAHASSVQKPSTALRMRSFGSILERSIVGEGGCFFDFFPRRFVFILAMMMVIDSEIFLGIVASGDEIRSNTSSPEKQEWRVKCRADTSCSYCATAISSPR
jgi:hypothetical protein